MDLKPFLAIPHTLTLFIAPPAWGKTTLLLDLPGPWIFVSPLRALAEEFAERAKQSGAKVKILRRRSDQAWENFAKRPSGILVATPETLPKVLPKEVTKKCFLVLDEFHLFLDWGADFRPLLREQFYAWSEQKISILALSATVEERHQAEIYRWAEHSFQHVFQIDMGNMRFKHPPTKAYCYSKIAQLKRRLVWEARKKNSSGIVFCHTRAQVYEWNLWFKRRGIKSLGCVGGEVERFRQELAKLGDVSWIVTTSALSHGVNLPSFKNVFIAYKPDNKSMWLQMAARGGRRGEGFKLHTLDKPTLIQKIKLSLFDMLVKLDLYLRTV